MVQLNQRDQKEFEKAQDLIENGGAGEDGFVRSLFFGRLDLSTMLPYPVQDADEAQRTDDLLKRLDRFMSEHLDPDDIDAKERIPQHVIDGLFDLGVMGMTVPRMYGGGGFSHTAYCRVLERIAQQCGSTAVFISAHQSIGLKALILMGTETQKQHWLPKLAKDTIAAFALTEPEAGSDAANVQTRAVLNEAGTHWILNGDKKFITNAALAGFMTVMARTEVEIDGVKKDKITAFIVSPDMPGFSVEKNNRSKCGIRGSWQAVLKFTNMAVPVENVLGEVGKGLKVALSVLAYGRCTLSAGCLGGAKNTLAKAVAHARKRRQFGRLLGDFDLIKKKIASMAESVYAIEALTYLNSGQVDKHDSDLMLETAITKLFSSEFSWQVIDDGLQVLGGEGYMRSTGIERTLRDARINRIVEGATEVMTSFVALMGMKGVGEEFEEILKAAKRPIHNFGRLARFVQHEVNDVLIGPSIHGLHAQLGGAGEQLAHLTRRLAREVTMALAKHQLGILDRQLVQERIAWSAIELYVMAAVIARLQATLDGTLMIEGHIETEDIDRDLTIGLGYCDHAAQRVEHRLDELHHNLDAKTLEVADCVLDLPKPDAVNGHSKN